MDHWGDPWADNNADDHKSLSKNEVTSSPSPAHASAPVLLSGFSDDAGWGNEDEGFGEWATSSGQEETATGAAEPRIVDLRSIESHRETSDDARWDTPGAVQDVIGDPNKELSATPDPSTTSQLHDVHEHIATNGLGQLQPDDASSARPSTSPSDTSRNEAPAESPRTSIEEDCSLEKHPAVEQATGSEHTKGAGNRTEEVAKSDGLDSEGASDGSGSFLEDTSWTGGSIAHSATMREVDSHVVEGLKELEVTSKARSEASPPTNAVPTVSSGAITLDMNLLDELFPARDAKELDKAPDDPIYSTAGRKAWYRLTRKQTLREFNSGTGDDNHVRVTWANSHIRSEVNKVIGRWAREDRISGTGPGARASFYWDTPATVDLKTTSNHSRTQSSLHTQRTIAPARQSLPPLPTNTPAAFNWSSPSTSIDPWKQDSPELRSKMSLIGLKSASAKNVQEQEHPPVSLDCTPPEPERATQKRTWKPVTETLTAASLVAPSFSNLLSNSSDPWAGLGSLDINSASNEAPVSAAVDDEDEWGEMVSSPTVSTPMTAESTSQVTTRDNPLSTPSSTPYSVNASPAQDLSADPMYASAVTRLETTMSPTSALFGAKSFVPLHVEQGLIGPGILKPAKRTVASVPEKSGGEVQSASTSEWTTEGKVQEKVLHVDGSGDVTAQKAASRIPAPDHSVDVEASFSLAFTPKPDSVQPSHPPAAAPAQTSMDAWADADFSVFESALPATAPAAPPLKHNPPDLFSALGTPHRSTNAASAGHSFTRSPPRDVMPPPSQRLTAATHARHHRQVEEDDVVREILNGLPDLRYMLR